MTAAVPRASFGPVTVYFGEKSGKYPDGNQVLVRGRDTTLAFDTPPVANRLAAELATADAVVLGHVHEDHMAGLHLLPHTPVQVHQADLAAAQSWDGLCAHFGYSPAVLADMRPRLERDFHYQPRPAATGYADGATWDLGGVRVRAQHLPGHTAGHCVLWVEPHGIAFIGDIDLSSFGPYYGDATSSLAQWRQSLATLATLDAAVWITSHHRGAVPGGAAFAEQLRAYTARLDEREQRVLQMLDDGPRSVAELARQRLLYPVDHQAAWVDDVEARVIGRHLDELRAAGRVAVDDGARYRRVTG